MSASIVMMSDDGHPITPAQAGRFTAGPWAWVVHPTSKRVQLLGGTPRYDLTLMDFTRWGMSGAAPRFREDVDRMNIMHRVEKWIAVVPGREHHADWFQTINHPDAQLIAAAPDLLASLREMVTVHGPHLASEELQRAKAAISKAEGK